ncbi:MAG: hypothetical protein E6Q97_08940 [Desulfurellales bacterium]|nr:MAG: hypothetical protein E6Q97_08940 [Desulfurellales bacterium]
MRKPNRGPVVLSWITAGQLEHFTVSSILDTYLFDYSNDRVLLNDDAGYIGQMSSPRIAESRSEIVRTFLFDPQLERAEWLWCIDTDMTWRPEALYQMLDVADPVERPVIGGLCFGGHPDGRIFPTLYSLARDEHGPYTEQIHEYPENVVLQVGATGAAFLLIHRSVFVRMAAPHPHGYGTRPDGTMNPYPWFYEGGIHKGRPFGEDIAFCMRLAALQIPLFVHTGVKVGHVKPTIMGESHYNRFRGERT